VDYGKENLMHATKMHFKLALLAVVIGLTGAGLTAWASADDDPYDQSKVALEVQPSDASLTKIVLVAGALSHGKAITSSSPAARS